MHIHLTGASVHTHTTLHLSHKSHAYTCMCCCTQSTAVMQVEELAFGNEIRLIRKVYVLSGTYKVSGVDTVAL